MKRFIPLLVVIVLLAMGVPALAADNPVPEIEWEKTFGGVDYDFPYSVQQTSDDGYITVGGTESYGAGGWFDVYLIKTDASGNKDWEKTFGGSGDWDNGFSVQQTSDGGYIVAGETDSYGAGYTDVYLIKTDASGNLTWEKTFGGSATDCAYSLDQTTDGGYIVAGKTSSYGAGYSDVYLIKTDASGNKDWEKTFGGSAMDYAHYVQQTADGGYIVAGTTASYGAGGEDFYLVKTDASGNKEWEKTLGGSSDDCGYSAQQTTDGGYIVAGCTISYGVGGGDVYLVKTDASGNKEWEKTFGGNAFDVAVYVEQTTDGGYIAFGNTDSFGAGGADLYLIKTDASGNMEWEKTIGGSGWEYAYSAQQTSDGGYITVGETDSYGAGGGDVYMVKLGTGINNTPVGENVTVSLPDGTATFPEVHESGNTTITTSTENPGGPTPSDYYVLGGEFVEITTTANYTGPVTVGVRYDESQVADEESLVIFHWDGSDWVDITTSVDTVENIVYGQVASLSSFCLGEPGVPPIADAGDPYLTLVDQSVELDGSASYDPDGTIVSYDWDFGDNTTGTGALVSHTYTAVGVYIASLTVTDDRGAKASDATMVVVYDPAAGSVTGGGWIDSPEGAYTADPSLIGKANFGFVSKYKKGADVPTGQTEFRFRVAGLDFHSTSYEWLVVAGARAKFKGEGTINGESPYKFKLTAIDADINPDDSFDIDRFRIKIWEEIGGEEAVIYDNALGDDSDNATTEIGGGSIMIHEG